MKKLMILCAVAMMVMAFGAMAQADDASVISVEEMASIKGFCGSGRCCVKVYCQEHPAPWFVGYTCDSGQIDWDECNNMFYYTYECAGATLSFWRC